MKTFLIKISILLLLSLLYCEFLADYIAMWSCKWPELQQNVEDDEVLHAMVIADTHLIGPINGHWLDKLYREWHMQRAFTAAIVLHHPDVVFILGDLFDEGDRVSQREFQKYTLRFHKLFHTPESIPLISVAGNHDVGFHYRMHPILLDRFAKHFNETSVSMHTIRGNHFIFINSMAMENDGCSYCTKAIRELESIKKKLDCLKDKEYCTNRKILEDHHSYSQPVILQHFPTFRLSDNVCKEYDADKLEDYRPKWEVLSKQATEWLGNLLKPRLALSGHSHHYCRVINNWGVEEYTVSSFNWRNKINPSFLMLSINPAMYGVNKCNMLNQTLVVCIYSLATMMASLLILWDFLKRLRKYLNGRSQRKPAEYIK